MATVLEPSSEAASEESREQVAHPLDRLRGYIRLYVVAEGMAVLFLSLALVFWLGLLMDYGVFKAFSVDWVQELGYVGRSLMLGFLFIFTLALIQLFRLGGKGTGVSSEPGPLKAARVAARSLSILAVGIPLRLARAPWYMLLLVVPFLLIYIAGWGLIGFLVFAGLHAEGLIALMVVFWMALPAVGLILARLFTHFGQRSLALVLERRFPKLLGDRLITAVELSKPRARQYGYSPAMLQMTIDDAAERVQKLPLGDVLNWTRLVRHGLALALITIGFYVCAGIGYCVIHRAGVGEFMHDFSDTAIIWFQRNILLMDTIWPRRAQLELLDFPDLEMKIGRDAPPPALHVRALKWVVADSNRNRAPEGWRALTWYDLTKNPSLIGGLNVPPLEAPFEPPNWRGTVDEVDFFLRGEAGKTPGSRQYLEVLDRLEEQGATPGMSRRLRKLIIPQQVTVYAKGASTKNEQMLVKQGENEFTGALADLKESIRFTIQGEDYYTPSRRIIVVPPPTIVRLVRDEDQPAYLYHRIPAGGKVADLKGKKQRLHDLEVSLTGDTSRFEVPSGADVILTAQTDKYLKPDAVRFLPPKKGVPDVKEPIEVLDSQTFQVRFRNVTTPLDFVFEFRDTDNVAGSRHVVIKPMEDQAPDVDVQVEIIRKTNQGYMVTPMALVPFSGKVRDDRGLAGLDFVYTVRRTESASDKTLRTTVAAGLVPRLASGPAVDRFIALGLWRSILQPAAADDENLEQQKVGLKGFAKLLAERGAQEDVPLAAFLERLEQPPPERAVLDRRMIKDFAVDPEDDDAKFNVESLNLRTNDEKAVQPHYVTRLWLQATDNNIEPGPRIGQSREKFTFIIVSEYELLAEIAKEEDGLRVKLEEAVGRLKDGRTKLDRVRQELPMLKPEEFSSQATQMGRVEEAVVKSWDAAREIHSEYKRILKELKANRVQSTMISKVSEKIVEPLDGAINQEFVRTDESLREFHKSLDGKKSDLPVADKSRAELTQLIDRLEGVLSAMADVMTINDLIRRLISIEEGEQQEIQRLQILRDLKEKEILEGIGEPKKP